MRGTATVRVTTRTAMATCCLAICALFLQVSPASALSDADLLTEFGGTGSGAGQMSIPNGVAADPVTGHIYVADSVNERIDEFTPWGGFVKAFGWDVAPGVVNERQEVRVRAAAGQFRLGFGASSTTDLPFDATATDVATALNALPSIGGVGGTVAVEERKGLPATGTPGIYVVTFKGSLSGTNTQQLTATDGTPPLSGGTPSTSIEARTVADGTPASTGLESCTAESGCKSGSSGAGTGQLAAPGAVVADQTGVYVLESSPPSRRIQKFDPAGRFLLSIGGEVNKTAVALREQQEANAEPVTVTEQEENLCTAASGDACGAGTYGSGSGQFVGDDSKAFAVGPSGAVYVGDRERIQVFDSAGEFQSVLALPGHTPWALTVDPESNDLLVSWRFNSGIELPPIEADVRRLNPVTGTELDSLDVTIPAGLAADSDGNLLVMDANGIRSGIPPHPDRLIEFEGGAGEPGAPFGEVSGDGIRGIAVNGVDDLLAAVRGNSVNRVRIYGTAPVIFESAPIAAPEILAQFATSVGTEGADLRARIDPKFWPDTRFFIEYGTSPCWQGGCEQQPLPPGLLLSSQIASTPLLSPPVSLSGLEPDQTYHYRFVAQSSGGGPAVGLVGKADAEAEATFTTRRTGSPGVPDSRAYELVSPAQKLSAEVGVDSPAGGGGVRRAAASGEKATFGSFTAFADPESGAGVSQYVSTRGPTGWTTTNLNLKGFLNALLRPPYLGFSDDLAYGAGASFEPPLTADAQPGFETVYWRNTATKELRAINTEVPNVEGAAPFCLAFSGSSVAGDRVIYASNGSFAGAPDGEGISLYEWSSASGVSLVSRLPGETAAAPAAQTGFGAGFGGCDPRTRNFHNVISSDGELIYWTYRPASGPTRLLVRAGGAATIQLDATQGGPGPAGGGRFLGASDDGTVVFFTDSNKLVSGASGANDLYRFDFAQPPGSRLTNVTAGWAPEIQGMLGMSESGDSIYFAAKGALADDTQPESCGGSDCNVYLWRQGEGIRFVGAIPDLTNWSENPTVLSSRVTPDGDQLVFRSTKPVTGYDNAVFGSPGCALVEGTLKGNPLCAEVYIYDAGADDISCASCSPTGQRPTGPASVPGWTNSTEGPRFASDDGNRVFFETIDDLVPADDNGETDVYLFERAGTGSCTTMSPSYNAASAGCQWLVSSGNSEAPSFLIDAGMSGRDVFLATRSRLVAADKDERYDVYDYREGGGFPEAPATPECEGEGCRPPANSAPAPAVAGTPEFVGPGNPKPKKSCPKGKVRRNGHCVKKQQKGGKKGKKGKQGKKTQASHRGAGR